MEDQECSSGCESGWTLYLEQSFLSPYPIPSPRGNNAHFIDQRCGGDFINTEDEDEEEDLSMVSDASSGPPLFQEDEHVYSNPNNVSYLCQHQEPVDAIATTLLSNKGVKKQNTKENRRRKPQDLPSFLDDTASSPFFNFPNNTVTLTNNQGSMEDMVDFSQGYSTTHFERKSTFQDHFGFYHHYSESGSQLQQNQWYEEKRMGMR